MKAEGVLGIHNPAPKFVERRERVNVAVLVGPSITAEIQVAQIYVARNEDIDDVLDGLLETRPFLREVGTHAVFRTLDDERYSVVRNVQHFQKLVVIGRFLEHEWGKKGVYLSK